MKNVFQFLVLLLLPLQVWAGIDLVVNNSDDIDPVPAGGTVTYTVIVTNNGFTEAATAVKTEHSIPASAEYRGVSGAGVSCTGVGIGENGTLNCTLPDLAAKGGNVSFDIQLETTAAGSITLGATASANETDSQSENDTDDENTVVRVGANIAIVKTGESSSVAAGSSFLCFCSHYHKTA